MPEWLKRHVWVLVAVVCLMILPAVAGEAQDGSTAVPKVTCDSGRFVLAGTVDPVTGGTVAAASEAIFLDGSQVTVPGCPSQTVQVLTTRGATWLAGFLRSCAGTAGLTSFFATIPSPACDSMTGWVAAKSSPLSKHVKRTFTANLLSLPPTIALVLSNDAIGLADRTTATWTVDGEIPAGALLQVRVRAPGSFGANPPAQSIQPGLTPPGGAVSFLQTDGTWSTSALAYGPAAAGNVALTLPSQQEGAWEVFAFLTDSKGDGVLATAARTLLVTSRPSIYLRRSRPVANSDDRVTVTLQTTGGAAPPAVRLAAWLQLPDGSQRGLPDLVPDNIYLFEGPPRNDRLILLDQSLSSPGTGDYRVEVRMMDAVTGATMASADAGVQVCDTEASVRGVVRDATGAAIGSGPEASLVQALDVDDAAVTATAPIDATGSFELVLRPGRYLMYGTVWDDAGVERSVGAPGLVFIDCDGTSQTVDLVERDAATAPLTHSLDAILLSEPTPVRSAGNQAGADALASGQCPGIRINVMYAKGADDPATQGIMSLLVVALRNTYPQAIFESPEDVQRMAEQLAEQQRTDTARSTDIGVFQEGSAQLALNFQLVLNYTATPSSKAIALTLVDQHKSQVQGVGSAFSGSYVVQEADLRDVVRRFGDLAGTVRANQLRPIDPHLTVSLSPTKAEFGATVTATATLIDCDGAPQGGKELELEMCGPGLGICPRDSGHTDDNGVWRPTFTTPAVAGTVEVSARFTQLNKPVESQSVFMEALDPGGNLTLESSLPAVKAGQSTLITVKVRQGTSPQQGIAVDLTSTNGALGAPTVVTGPDGTATVTFTGGPVNGEAKVTGEAHVPPPPLRQGPRPTDAPTPLEKNLYLVVDGGVTLNLLADDVVSGGAGDIQAQVLIEGQPARNVQIVLSVYGAGAITPSTGLTQDDGKFLAKFFAPPASAGSGTSIITATVVVDGQLYTRTAAVRYAPGNGCSPPNGASYCITPLPEIDDPNRLGLNNKGQVVYINYYNGFLWDAGVVTPLVVNTEGEHFVAINDSGAIAIGLAGSRPHGYLWKDGVVTDLGSFQPTSINNSGKMCGVHYFGQLPQEQNYSYQDVSVVIWDAGSETTIWDHLDLPQDWIGCSINDAGDAIVQFGNYGVTYFRRIPYYPTFWRDGGLTNLAGALPSTISRVTPTALNKPGTVIGSYLINNNGGFWSWQPGDANATVLGEWAGPTGWFLPEGLNDAGVIVGACEFGGYGCTLKDGVRSDLQSKIDPTSNYLLGIAWRINNQGQILVDCHVNGATWDITTRCLLTPSGVQVPVP